MSNRLDSFGIGFYLFIYFKILEEEEKNVDKERIDYGQANDWRGKQRNFAKEEMQRQRFVGLVHLRQLKASDCDAKSKTARRGYQLGWTGPMTAWLMTHVIFCRDGNNEGRKGFRHPPTYSLYFIYGLSSSILLELPGRRR